LRALAACLLALSLTNAIARDFTARDAETFAAAARANPRDPSPQEVIKLAREMGAARNLDALDAMLALKHAGLVGTYSKAFLDGNRGRPAPAIEERLLRHYDDPRLAVSLLWALDRYESPALFERLLDDVARYATRSREQTRLCRFVGREPPPVTPMVFGLGVPKRQVYLGCPPSFLGGPEVFRADTALRLIGNTALPGVESRVSIHIADLVSVPPADPGAVPEDGHSLGASRVFALASIARLLGERRYTPVAPALIAALGGLNGDSRQDVEAAMPLLGALGEMDLREGSETIARWIERRSRGRFPINESPRLLDMIRLLAGVLPEGQIDVEPLRDRVLANVPQARALDKSGKRGPLLGVPFGVKDIIDTCDMPTEYGTPIYKGHRPRNDAACVALSRKAGAGRMGAGSPPMGIYGLDHNARALGDAAGVQRPQRIADRGAARRQAQRRPQAVRRRALGVSATHAVKA